MIAEYQKANIHIGERRLRYRLKEMVESGELETAEVIFTNEKGHPFRAAVWWEKTNE